MHAHRHTFLISFVALAVPLLATAETRADWWPQIAPGISPMHPAMPAPAPIYHSFTEDWPVLQPGWGIPTLQNGRFRGAYWILDMNQPLLPPVATDRAVTMPPPQRHN